MITISKEIQPNITVENIVIDVSQNTIPVNTFDNSSFTLVSTNPVAGEMSLDINKILKQISDGIYTFTVRDSNPQIVTIKVIGESTNGIEFQLDKLDLKGDAYDITGWLLDNSMVYYQIAKDDGFVYIKCTTKLRTLRDTVTGLKTLTFTKKLFDDVSFSIEKVSRVTNTVVNAEPIIITLEPASMARRGSRSTETGVYITGSYSELVSNFTSSIDRYHNLTDEDDNEFSADFSDFKNFIFFGSAQKTFQVAYNKLKSYYNTSQSLVSASASLQNAYTQSLINDYSEFTSYEKWLFKDKEGYPKSGIYSKSLTNPDAAYIQTWYTNSITTASIYDSENSSYLKWNVPAFYYDYDNEDIFQNLIDMVGSYFDEVKIGIDNFARLYHNDVNYWDHAPNRLMKHVIDSLGFEQEDLFATEEFYKYLLGTIDRNGVSFVSTVSLKELMNKFYVNLFNNLPYLIKTKGTKESIEALFNVFGVSSTIFKPREYVINDRIIDSRTVGRIADDRMFYSLQFGSGSTKHTKMIMYSMIPYITGGNGTLESASYTYLTQIKWPNFISSSVPSTTMSLWQAPLSLSSNITYSRHLYFAQYETASFVGTSSYNHRLTLRRYERQTGSVVASIAAVPIDYNKFYTVYLQAYSGSGGLTEKMGIIERTNDLITNHKSASFLYDETDPNYPDMVHNLMTNSLEFGGAYYYGTVAVSPLTASVNSMKIYNQALSSSILESHALDYKNIYGMTTESTKRLVAWYRMNENYDVSAGETASLLDGSPWNNRYLQSASLYGFTLGTASWIENYDKIYIDAPLIDTDLAVDEKLFINGPPSYSAANDNRISLTLSPYDEVNRDIVNTLANVQFADYQIQPIERYRKSYKGLNKFRDMYFEKFNSSSTVDVETFFKLAKQMNTTIFNVAYKLLPERSIVEKGVMIKSTVFEKPKYEQQIPTITAIEIKEGENNSFYTIKGSKESVVTMELYPNASVSGSWQTSSKGEYFINYENLTGSLTKMHPGNPTLSSSNTADTFDYYNISSSVWFMQAWKFPFMNTTHKQLRYAIRKGSGVFYTSSDITSASSVGGILTVTPDIRNENLTFFNFDPDVSNPG